jgi:hypothetical protein
MPGQAPWRYPEDNADAVALRSLVRELETPTSAKGGPDTAQRWREAMERVVSDLICKCASRQQPGCSIMDMLSGNGDANGLGSTPRNDDTHVRK